MFFNLKALSRLWRGKEQIVATDNTKTSEDEKLGVDDVVRTTYGSKIKGVVKEVVDTSTADSAGYVAYKVQISAGGSTHWYSRGQLELIEKAKNPEAVAVPESP
jgi:hypothetical protein